MNKINKGISYYTVDVGDSITYHKKYISYLATHIW